jgi:hypothetical protein
MNLSPNNSENYQLSSPSNSTSPFVEASSISLVAYSALCGSFHCHSRPRNVGECHQAQQFCIFRTDLYSHLAHRIQFKEGIETAA